VSSPKEVEVDWVYLPKYIIFWRTACSACLKSTRDGRTFLPAAATTLQTLHYTRSISHLH